MDNMQKGIITLIKSAVMQEPQALPGEFDLEQAWPHIRRHHIAPLIFEGALLCGIPRQTPVMQKLFQSYCKALQISEGQLRELGRIYTAFDQAGIDYMPLKGCNMKHRYPKAELRSMGDADILIRMEQYPQIVPVMESLGYTFRLESDHELIWDAPGLHVELHKVLIPTYNPDFHGYFGDGWRLAVAEQGSRFGMRAADEFVYLFTHFSKHYRDGGIGCRHVADLWVFLRQASGLDEKHVEASLEKLHLTAFYRNMRRVLEVWFEDAPGDEKTNFMTDGIFSAGSFGTHDSKLQSLMVRDSKHAPQGISGRLLYIFRVIFPSAAALRQKYTVLQKAPWLFPVVWIGRPVYKVLFERETFRIHGRNLKNLDAQKLRTRQDSLHYVGLDYFMGESQEKNGKISLGKSKSI